MRITEVEMKATLYSTLVLSLAILAATVTLSNRLASEARKTRISIAKTQTVPSDGTPTDAVLQKLDAINAQLVNFNRRLNDLEERATSLKSATTADGAETLSSGLATLPADIHSLRASLARLDGIPLYLAQLTTFLDRSFDHMEKTMHETSAVDGLAAPLDNLAQKLDVIDSSFTPLYVFLGCAYDPDAMEGYPSMDQRITDLFLAVDTLKTEVAGLQREFDRAFPLPPKR